MKAMFPDNVSYDINLPLGTWGRSISFHDLRGVMLRGSFFFFGDMVLFEGLFSFLGTWYDVNKRKALTAISLSFN